MPNNKHEIPISAPESRHELRLVNILFDLYRCNSADIVWNGSGSSDTVEFKIDGCRYILKLAKESVQGKSADTMDFRVRVITM